MTHNRIMLVVLLGVVAAGWHYSHSRPKPVPSPTPTPIVSAALPSASPEAPVSPTPSPATVPPIADFMQRVTKKFFGTYVTPTSSPVSPEKFTGYHTGVDVEYTDTSTDVPVYAIAAGTVRTSSFASGYGGVMVIEHTINGRGLFAVYGHLRQSSMLAAGTAVKQGDTIAVLGTGYSAETDGERRHLHFGIATSTTILGYATSTAALNAGWIDPLSLYP